MGGKCHVTDKSPQLGQAFASGYGPRGAPVLRPHRAVCSRRLCPARFGWQQAQRGHDTHRCDDPASAAHVAIMKLAEADIAVALTTAPGPGAPSVMAYHSSPFGTMWHGITCQHHWARGTQRRDTARHSKGKATSKGPRDTHTHHVGDSLTAGLLSLRGPLAPAHTESGANLQ